MGQRASIVLCAAILMPTLFGCGGSSAAPTAPASVPSTLLATVVSVRIIPDATILRPGETQQFSIEVELSEGIPPTGPAPNWSTTDATILAVAANGTATGVGRGVATLRVEFRGNSATRQVQVLP